MGFAKGFGLGIGGALVKPMAGVGGVIAYPFKGIHKEVQKLQFRSDEKHIRSSLISQGMLELRSATPEVRQEVLCKWKELGASGKERAV